MHCRGERHGSVDLERALRFAEGDRGGWADDGERASCRFAGGAQRDGVFARVERRFRVGGDGNGRFDGACRVARELVVGVIAIAAVFGPDDADAAGDESAVGVCDRGARGAVGDIDVAALGVSCSDSQFQYVPIVALRR